MMLVRLGLIHVTKTERTTNVNPSEQTSSHFRDPWRTFYSRFNCTSQQRWYPETTLGRCVDENLPVTCRTTLGEFLYANSCELSGTSQADSRAEGENSSPKQNGFCLATRHDASCAADPEMREARDKKLGACRTKMLRYKNAAQM